MKTIERFKKVVEGVKMRKKWADSLKTVLKCGITSRALCGVTEGLSE